MTLDEVQEEIRQMKWDLRILRDRAFQIAPSLPPADLERLAEIADRISEATRELLEAMAQDESESEAETVARLRGGMDHLQQQLRLIAHELDEVSGGPTTH